LINHSLPQNLTIEPLAFFKSFAYHCYLKQTKQCARYKTATYSPAKPKILVDWQRKKPYWLVAVMNFSDYFYIANNLCLVAQQNIPEIFGIGWGRISLSSCRLLAGLRAWRPGEVGQHLSNI